MIVENPSGVCYFIFLFVVYYIVFCIEEWCLDFSIVNELQRLKRSLCLFQMAFAESTEPLERILKHLTFYSNRYPCPILQSQSHS